MYLTIINWQRSDESQFSCISTNSLGKADGRIQSYSKHTICINLYKSMSMLIIDYQHFLILIAKSSFLIAFVSNTDPETRSTPNNGYSGK